MAKHLSLSERAFIKRTLVLGERLSEKTTRKASKSHDFEAFCGDKRDRTADPLNAMFACREHDA